MTYVPRFAPPAPPAPAWAGAAVRAEVFVAALDALCKAHGVRLEHEDFHGRFEVYEAGPGEEAGFEGSVALILADGTRRYL